MGLYASSVNCCAVRAIICDRTQVLLKTTAMMISASVLRLLVLLTPGLQLQLDLDMKNSTIGSYMKDRNRGPSRPLLSLLLHKFQGALCLVACSYNLLWRWRVHSMPPLDLKIYLSSVYARDSNVLPARFAWPCGPGERKWQQTSIERVKPRETERETGGRA